MRLAVPGLLLLALSLLVGVGSDRTNAEGADLAADALLRGEAIFTANGCMGCHGEGGRPLVALSTYTDEELSSLILAPANPTMPAFGFSDTELADLVAFLKQRYP
ncbi:MAG: cytochrome c [Alphaproteobacteria bacterium]|nr:cytochrome c [Alphaproteobacteria bacterium]